MFLQIHGSRNKKKMDEFDDLDNKFDRALEAAGLKSNSNGGLHSGADSGKHCLITHLGGYFMFYEIISLHACHDIGKVMLESNKDLSCPKPDQ